MGRSLPGCRAAAGGLLAILATAAAVAAPESSWVFRAADGQLDYRIEADGDRIPDFAAVGFGAGWTDLPAAPPAMISLAPIAGDNTARIQAALDAVGDMPLQPSGFRGAVLLTGGSYEIAGQLKIRASGVVLKGSGAAGSSATRLVATGTSTRSLLTIGSSSAGRTFLGPRIGISTERVPVGATSFEVVSTDGLVVGQPIDVRWSSNQAWIDAIGMDDLDNPWQPGSRKQNFDRIITRIEGNRVHLDAPLTMAIDTAYGGGTIQRYTFPDRITHVGVENLIGQSLTFRDESNEARSRTFISVEAAENVFVRDIEARHFVFAAVNVEDQAKFVTVADSRSVQPAGLVSGSRRYTYNVDGQLVLVRDSTSSEGRHDFVTESDTAGPNVFVNSSASNALNDAGPHQRWATGILFDNVTIAGDGLNVRDRGNSGTGQGWAGANTVIWNSSADSFIVQDPPTARNWLIGSPGRLETVGGKSGTYDSLGTPVTLGNTATNPAGSLYLAQLEERRTVGVDLRFWVGDQGPRWDGSNGWTNWSRTLEGRTNAPAPGPRDDVVFNLPGTTGASTRPGVDTSIHGLVIDAASAPVTIWLGSRDGRLALGPHGITAFAGTHAIRGDAGGSGTPGDLLVDGPQVWELRGTSQLTIAARIGGAGSTLRTISKTGTGTLVLAAANGGTGGFRANWLVEEGRVRLEHADAFGWSYNPVTVAAGAAVDLAGVGLGAHQAEITLAGTGSDGTGALRSLNGDVSVPAGLGRFVLAGGGTGIGVDAGTLTMQRTIGGPGQLVKLGSGRLVLEANNAFTGGTAVKAGTLEIASGAALSAASASSPQPLAVIGGRLVMPAAQRTTLELSKLDIRASAGAELDLGAGRIRVAAGGIAPEKLRADLLAGRGRGTWEGGKGITSTAAAASSGTRSVGYVVAADGSADVSFAAPGDIDLSGRVDVFDLLAIDGAGQFNTGTPAVWSQGDFDYDGVATVFDLISVSTAGVYNAGGYFPTAVSFLGGALLVPEPTGWECLMIAAVSGRLLWQEIIRRQARQRPYHRSTASGLFKSESGCPDRSTCLTKSDRRGFSSPAVLA